MTRETTGGRRIEGKTNKKTKLIKNHHDEDDDGELAFSRVVNFVSQKQKQVISCSQRPSREGTARKINVCRPALSVGARLRQDPFNRNGISQRFYNWFTQNGARRRFVVAHGFGAERALLYETRRYYYYYYFVAGATRPCHFPGSVRYHTITISDVLVKKKKLV